MFAKQDGVHFGFSVLSKALHGEPDGSKLLLQREETKPIVRVPDVVVRERVDIRERLTIDEDVHDSNGTVIEFEEVPEPAAPQFAGIFYRELRNLTARPAQPNLPHAPEERCEVAVARHFTRDGRGFHGRLARGGQPGDGLGAVRRGDGYRFQVREVGRVGEGRGLWVGHVPLLSGHIGHGMATVRVAIVQKKHLSNTRCLTLFVCVYFLKAMANAKVAILKNFLYQQ